MTKSIQQINQDLETLKSTVAEAGGELEQLYQEYLSLLGQALNRQLILACYQICTELYPQAFIDLSLSEKQDLQQDLRQIGLQTQPKLVEIMELKELEPEPTELNLMAELIKKLPTSKRRKEDQEAQGEEPAEVDFEAVKAELENIEFIALESSADEEDETSSESKSSTTQPIDFENPEHLMTWQRQIERQIKKALSSVSRNVNQSLQQSKILPERIPNKVFDVAIQADTSKMSRNSQRKSSHPHILNLAIETDKEKKSKSSSQKPLQISLLRMRLVELEFVDHQLSAQRGKIRNLMNKINKLDHQYQSIQRQSAVIEAQSAWRSSWYED